MIKVTFLYPNVEGSRFDLDYYGTAHVALVRQKLGEALKNLSINYGLSGIAPGSKPSFHAIGNLSFDSLAAFYEAFAPHIEEFKADAAKYTDVEPIIQISDVRI
jgi:uncharacterized protein (TIGR02118 family)